MNVTSYKRWNCVKCGYAMDSASHPTDAKAVPVPGDLSVCLRCAEPYILDGDSWRPLTDDELIDIPLEDKKILSKMQTIVIQFNKLGRGKK